MEMVKVSQLVPHPRNNEFFDDITGSCWNDFLESVKTSGIIEPIIMTENYVIVSGHQRVRACKELGIEEIMAEIKNYEGDEKRIIKDLVETNVRQRGTVAGSADQVMARYRALADWYGVYQGNHGNNIPHNTKCSNGAFSIEQQDDNLSTVKREELLEILGLTKKQYETAKKISENAIPEVKQLLEDGVVSQRTVSDLIAKLSVEDQQKLVDALPANTKFKASTIQEYIDKRINDNYADHFKKVRELETRIAEKTREINELKFNAKPIPAEVQNRLDELQQSYRSAYENWQSAKKVIDKKDEELKKLTEELDVAKAKASGDEGVKMLETRIGELNEELERERQNSEDIRERLENAKATIDDLREKEKSRPFESALKYPANDPQTHKREIEQLCVDIQTAVGSATTEIKGFRAETGLIQEIQSRIKNALAQSVYGLINEAKTLLIALENEGNDDAQSPEDDDDFDFEDLGA